MLELATFSSKCLSPLMLGAHRGGALSLALLPGHLFTRSLDRCERFRLGSSQDCKRALWHDRYAIIPMED